MKTIELRRLSLSFFKGIKEETVTFGFTTSISADNRVGKTTIFDAFTWLLFGKDSLGRADFDIKTLNPDGTVIPDIDHTVEAEILVNGALTTLKRTYRENWVKRRGSSEAMLQGHTTECFWDGVPVNVSEYNKLIAGLCPEELFRLITDPLHFNTRLDKRERRKILIALAGNITHETVAEGHPELEALILKMAGRTPEQYKAMILAQKKTVKENLANITPRIDEHHQTMPEEQDWKAIEANINAINAELDQLALFATNRPKADQAILQNKYNEINQLNAQVFQTVEKANKAAQLEAEDSNTQVTALRKELAEVRAKYRSVVDLTFQHDEMLQKYISLQDRLARQLQDKQQDWRQCNAVTYTPADQLICPIYKHPCSDHAALEQYATKEDSARQEFAANKQKTLTQIGEEGTTISRLKQEAAALEAETRKVIASTDDQKFELEARIQELETQLAETPASIPFQYKATDLDECQELQKRIDILKQEVEAINNPIQDEGEAKAEIENKNRIAELKGQREVLQGMLTTQGEIATKKQRIQLLEKQRGEFAEALNDIERDEHLIELLSRALADELDLRINGKFEWVKFRLFDTQLNGGTTETCDTIINGVPYQSANNEARINAGLDIINALNNFYEICAPIWIDNRESVNWLQNTESQMISLIVSNDKQLTTIASETRMQL